MRSFADRLALCEQSPLALGCWALGGKYWGGQAETRSFEVMEEAYSSGIRHFDTAEGYGVSEDLVGRFIEDKRDSVFLATKVFPQSVEGIRDALKRSLDRLRTDTIDLYYLHWPREHLEIQPQMEVLAEARDAGHIGFIGVSNYSVAQLRAAAEVAPVDFLQSGYHLFWRTIEKAVLPYCREMGIRVVSYSSLGQGILTGKFPLKLSFPKGDHRTDVVHFADDVWPHVHAAVEQLKPLADQAGRPLAHLAIQWAASRPGMHTVLAGARNREQMRENSAAINGKIDPAILEEMTQISDALMPRLPDEDNIFKVHF